MNNKIFLMLLFFIFISGVVALGETSFGAEIVTSDYSLSRDVIKREISQGGIFSDILIVKNLRNSQLEVILSVSSELADVVEVNPAGIMVSPNNFSEVYIIIKGTTVGNYSGKLSFSGDIKEEVPINVSVVDFSRNPDFLLEINLQKEIYYLNKPLEFKVNINRLKPIEINDVNLSYVLIDSSNREIFLGAEKIDILSSFQIVKKVDFPNDFLPGEYVLESRAQYYNSSLFISSKSYFVAKIAFMDLVLFDFLPMWLLVYSIGTVLLILLIIFLIKRNIEMKKKYKMSLDKKSLPKKDSHFLYLGKIAETETDTFFEPNRFATHCIVAGATGGGKSIAAQVIVEEALSKNISVIVFDPTAQWSGMLRKCEDKRMTSLYPRFGLKPSDARGFPGNIRQITDARQIIEIDKHMQPGHIQIFTMNKLDPKDMDVFVANVVRQIFRSDPKESPDLKVLLVFDEVHRLLAKFGGTGEGFLQIERACREFRKWGMGVLLVSQVLSDFVGEIKANINTEVQMRTRDEGDLNRIKVKYGEDFLRSLVKASVGAGMIVNPAYNHASPYFVQFRPILHNTRRLPDEELEKYNSYNDQVDDLDYQIEQLEQEKVDTFDLKMELKLVKDKMMSGNFSVVDIYLEGLKPRVAKQWEKLGKQPKKKQLILADMDEIKKSVEEAKKQRDKISSEEAAKKEAEEKKEEVLEEKIIKPLTFDNGVMVSSLKELKGFLPTLDNEIFAVHVNDSKNDIADFVAQLFPEDAAKMKAVKTKDEIVKMLEPLGKAKK